MTTKNHGTFLQKDTDNHPSGINPVGIEVTDQTVDPSGTDLPATGDYLVYTKSGVAYLIDHAGTATAIGSGASFATPAIVLGTAAAAGVATTVIRSDSTIVAFDATVPVTQAMGDSAATGSATVASRRDHKHGMPALGSTAADIGTSAGGSATTPSKSDHVHATGAGTPSTQAIGDAASTGTGPAAAMTDHKHAITNPLTTQDDLWVGGASGAPGRLAKGADSQVLTVDPSTHHLVWANPASGFTNPMTTAGDLIVGDTGGAAIRLAKGADSTVLTISASTHLPVWTAGGSASLEVKEIDGAPDVTGVSVIQVSNGTLTDNGGGNVTITTGGGGGGGTPAENAAALVAAYNLFR